ncbi:MAG: pectate lyase, partial [Ignavibacteriales bacterium]|nr:pectate lyase [Ignavibacteriales bacterium]
MNQPKTHCTSRLKGLVATIVIAAMLPAHAQETRKPAAHLEIDISGFYDSSHHWYDIQDEDRIITPEKDQQRYAPSEIRMIADNILLFQKSNGGWPKNYDMLALLTPEQREAVLRAKEELNTGFDNGATYTQVEYLAKAFAATSDKLYQEGCLRGIGYILSAQYPNGGWPQFFPDTSGYRKYITFNDGAMIGVMKTLQGIVERQPRYSFVDKELVTEVGNAFRRGIDCILRCQIRENGVLTAWCQQHDNIDFRPREARVYELPSISGQEGAEVALFLMSVQNPTHEVVASVEAAVQWFRKSQITGIRIEEINAPTEQFIYHTSSNDKVVVTDPNAPPIWARFYELGTGKPLFSDRKGKRLYSMAEVERERRTGYGWYSYTPEEVLK